MANLQIYQLPNKPSLSSTDLFGIDDATIGHVSWNISAAQIAAFVNSTLPASPANIIYVAPTGNDSTGSGSLASPFATITHALSSITTNSSSNPYLIYVIPGVYNESSLIIKPWVYIEGNNATLNLSSSVGLDNGWTTAVGQSFIQNFTISLSVDAFNINFTIGTGRASLLVMRNIIPVSVPNIRVTGTSLETIIFDNVYNNDGSTKVNIQDVNGSYGSSSFSNFSFVNTRTDNPLNFVIYNINTSLTVSINSTGTQIVKFYMKGCITQSSIVASGSPTNLFLDGASTNVSPTLSLGATVTLLGKSNNYDANYTPTNYTAVDSSIRGNINGIDNKLTSFPLKTNNLSDLSNTLIGAENLGLYNGYINFISNMDYVVSLPLTQGFYIQLTASGHSITLPDATTLNNNNVGRNYWVHNTGSVSVSIKDNTGGLIGTAAAGVDYWLLLISQSTQAGTWYLLPVTPSLVSFTTDNLSEGTNNLYLSKDGGITTHQSSFNNFVFNSLSAGTNVSITQPGGSGTQSVISSTGSSGSNVKTLMVMLSPQLNFQNGSISSLFSTVSGTNVIPANTLVAGNILVMNITGLSQGTTSGGSMLLSCLFGGPIIPSLVGNSISVRSNLGGAGSARCWNLTYQITILNSTQYIGSATGWYEDDNHVVQSLRIYTNPVLRPFNAAVQNIMDVQETVTVSVNNTFGFYAYNLSLVLYSA